MSWRALGARVQQQQSTVMPEQAQARRYGGHLLLRTGLWQEPRVSGEGEDRRHREGAGEARPRGSTTAGRPVSGDRGQGLS